MDGTDKVLGEDDPEHAAQHVTIWNRLERRKIAGNAAPLRRNLEKYLSKHPECEVYAGQERLLEQAGIARPNEHVPIWHRVERRKVTGNAAPLRKNVELYLARHPDCEVYVGQDKGFVVEERADPAVRFPAFGNAGMNAGATGHHQMLLQQHSMFPPRPVPQQQRIQGGSSTARPPLHPHIWHDFPQFHNPGGVPMNIPVQVSNVQPDAAHQHADNPAEEEHIDDGQYEPPKSAARQIPGSSIGAPMDIAGSWKRMRSSIGMSSLPSDGARSISRDEVMLGFTPSYDSPAEIGFYLARERHNELKAAGVEDDPEGMALSPSFFIRQTPPGG